MRVPGRMVFGSMVKVTPFAFSSATAASRFSTVSPNGRGPYTASAASAGACRVGPGDEDLLPGQVQIDARRAIRLRRADHLGAELVFVPLRRRCRVGRAQMDMLPGVLGHVVLPVELTDAH